MSILRKLAKGQECQVRLPGICNFNPETTVLAHLNGGGMGMKHHDLFGAWACSNCHDAIDRRTGTHTEKKALNLWHLEGVIRTQKKLLEMGVIRIGQDRD